MAEPDRSNPARDAAPAPAPDDAERQLGRLRSGIDRVDQAILELLNERAELVSEVGRVKHATGTAVYEEARERRIVAELAERSTGPFPNAGLAPVFREIISATRSLEDRLPIAYLGPEGTFCHMAASQKFGELAQLKSVPTIQDVFSAVERGAASLGVVPVENTTEGIVTQTLDALGESEVTICGEVQVRVANHMVSQTGRLADVRRVASHPQALAQCRQWLERNLPGVERFETPSTTAAAQLATDDGATAAICSAVAGELVGMAVFEAAIEDRRDNTTRFLVIGSLQPAATGNDLTCAVFTIRKDEPGGLHRLLQPFAEERVNLTSIQLRPIKGKPWEYLFFIDLEGHRSEPRVAKALDAVAGIANSHRVMGSFPRAELGRGAAGGDR